MKKFFYLGLLAGFITSCTTHQPKAVIVNREGNNISYTTCGDGDTTLLFLHGWCINKTYWDGQLKEFCPQYKVVAVDLPGFGSSGKNRTNWSFDEYVKDITAVIDQLKLKNVVLIGHSMSGDIIISMSAQHPENIAGIVGIDNLHEPGGPLSENDQQSMTSFLGLLEKSFDSVANVSMKGFLFQPTTDSAVVNRVMNDIYSSDSSVAVKVLTALSTVSQKEKEVMPLLNHRLYLIDSDVNPVNADSLNKYCRKGFALESVHGTGHYPMIEKPGEFNAALHKVLASISRGDK